MAEWLRRSAADGVVKPAGIPGALMTDRHRFMGVQFPLSLQSKALPARREGLFVEWLMSLLNETGKQKAPYAA